jgi:hypothetical protein
VSRALDLLAALRLLPSPLLSVWIYRLALSIGEDADRATARALRAIGERDEARRDRDLARGAERACYEREAATGRAHQAALEVANRSCVELQDEVDRARAERDALAVVAQGLRVELAKGREGASSAPSMLDEVGNYETQCAHCLGDVGVLSIEGPAEVDASGRPNHAGPTLTICIRCHSIVDLTWRQVRARVAARLASCPARRTSADPLAVECINCGALAGAMCTP